MVHTLHNTHTHTLHVHYTHTKKTLDYKISLLPTSDDNWMEPFCIHDLCNLIASYNHGGSVQVITTHTHTHTYTHTHTH